MADKYLEEWDRYNMGDIYPYPDYMLAESERIHAKWRADCFNIVRSNPSFCGYSVTGTVDQGYLGEGVWTTWREFKPEVADVFVVGHAPLLWCLFIEQMHVYSGRQFKVEAVLANEDILKPGTYPVSFKIAGKEGVVWERKMDFVIPEPEAGKSVPLAFQVMTEYVVINTLEDGEFSFCAHMEKGGAPAGGIKKFYISNNDNLTLNDFEVSVFGIEMKTQQWLQSHGVKCNSYNKSQNQDKCDGEIILAGNLSNMNLIDEDWATLYDRIEKGSKVVFLSPEAFKKEDKITENLPFENKGECWLLENWLYHKEDVAKSSILFDDLQCGGILDWNYYSEVIPDYVFVKLDTPDQTEVASFSTGYDCEYRCFSGFVNGSYKKGKGSFMLNALRIEENLDINPAADRLLLNIIRYAAQT